MTAASIGAGTVLDPCRKNNSWLNSRLHTSTPRTGNVPTRPGEIFLTFLDILRDIPGRNEHAVRMSPSHATEFVGLDLPL